MAVTSFSEFPERVKMHVAAIFQKFPKDTLKVKWRKIFAVFGKTTMALLQIHRIIID